MVDFWSERVEAFGTDPRANTPDVWLREIEIRHAHEAIGAAGATRVLDFGCANGYSTLRLARQNPAVEFVGVDINGQMIEAARRASEHSSTPNVRFERRNLLEEPIDDTFSMVIAIRAFQNLPSPEAQKLAVDALSGLLDPRGRLLMIESYRDGYAQLNDDRGRMGLEALPIHEHLTLLSDELDRYAAGVLTPLHNEALSSAYYLVTRLAYSMLAKESGEPIDYDHPLHRIAAAIPQIGDYGPLRSVTYERT